MAEVTTKPITELLPALRKERGWSREILSHHAYGIDAGGTSLAMIAAIERGERRASARTMLALAKALEIEPTTFVEYRLALARHVLDEERVGLDRALENLGCTTLEPIDVAEAEIRRFSPDRGRARAERQAATTRKRTSML